MSCAQALIDCVTLLLLKRDCITDKEAEGLLDLALENDMLTAKELLLNKYTTKKDEDNRGSHMR